MSKRELPYWVCSWLPNKEGRILKANRCNRMHPYTDGADKYGSAPRPSLKDVQDCYDEYKEEKEDG